MPIYSSGSQILNFMWWSQSSCSNCNTKSIYWVSFYLYQILKLIRTRRYLIWGMEGFVHQVHPFKMAVYTYILLQMLFTAGRHTGKISVASIWLIIDTHQHFFMYFCTESHISILMYITYSICKTSNFITIHHDCLSCRLDTIPACHLCLYILNKSIITQSYNFQFHIIFNL